MKMTQESELNSLGWEVIKSARGIREKAGIRARNGGILFSMPDAIQFGLSAGQAVWVMWNEIKQMVGIKIVTGDDAAMAFRVIKEGSGLKVCCGKFVRDHNLVGSGFAGAMNHTHRILLLAKKGGSNGC